MNLDTLMSHITYIIPGLALLINFACCQRLRSRNKDSGNVQSCVTPWWKTRHVTYLQLQRWKATKLCHVTASFCSILSSKKSVWHPASHFKDTYATWQKLLQAPSHVWISILYLGFCSFSHIVLINGGKLFPFYSPWKHQISKDRVRPVTLHVYVFLSIHTEPGFCIP